ncbi:hypothetical protein QWZ06_07665 [Chryseobacterium tructae]|nr:hypothetical protein [Chryseobacterium tructae]MDN3692146.1 hypothetical protein [Chryseobacterium tructae]
MMKTPENYFFKLFANCIPVKGEEEILLFDLHKISYLEIDEYIYDLITNTCEIKNISEIKNDSELREDSTDILDFLVENDFGFYVNDVNQYPKINTSYVTPDIINNSIIEVENFENYDIESVLTLLNDLFCGKVEIWVKDKMELEKLVSIVKKFENSFMRTIQIVLNHHLLSDADIAFIDQGWKDLNKTELIIYNHTISKSERNFYFSQDDLSLSNYISQSQNPIYMNLHFYLESLEHNVFLNKKVCIDKKGMIKNFISFEKSFGNVNTDRLSDIVESADFQKLWFVNNDYINQIKHSALRYCFPITDELSLDSTAEFYNIPEQDSYPWNIKAE